MTELATVAPVVPRNGKQQPLIIPLGGGDLVAYTRCTTYVGCLEDMYNVQRWQQRMVVLGLVDRPDLLLSAAAHRDDKQKISEVADNAIEAAKAHAARTVGTALHALCARIDAGQDVGPVPGEYQRDLDAYVAATKDLTILHSETFTVLDDLRIGGTPDAIVEYQGERYIADIKSGNIDYGPGKIAMQLAVYARSQFYNPTTGDRTPLPGVNQERGIVVHLPAGTGTCRLLWTNIAAGWEGVQLATRVREWRTRKDLATDFTAAPDPVLASIESAATTEDLVAIWTANETHWRQEYTTAAATRKHQLAQTA